MRRRRDRDWGGFGAGLVPSNLSSSCRPFYCSGGLRAGAGELGSRWAPCVLSPSVTSVPALSFSSGLCRASSAGAEGLESDRKEFGSRHLSERPRAPVTCSNAGIALSLSDVSSQVLKPKSRG